MSGSGPNTENAAMEVLNEAIRLDEEAGTDNSEQVTPTDSEDFLVTPFQRFMRDAVERILDENEALAGEIRAARTDIANLRTYVEELENRAQEMASPENIQKQMNQMLGGMGMG